MSVNQHLVPIVIEKSGRTERAYDIYSRLLKDRIIFLGQQVDDQISNSLVAQMLFLQLKSGDSYTRKRKRDGSEIFDIKDERHARYWMAQQFPVMLVIRNSEGEVRWMEVRDWLRRESDNGKKTLKQIIFEGERFDVMAVRRWRDKVLQSK